MKTNLLVGLILSLSFSVCAQRVIEKPYVESNNSSVFFIDKISVDDDRTVIECTLKSKKKGYSIPTGTYIIAEGTKDKLHIKTIAPPHSLNSRLTPEKTGLTKLTLTFPALPKDVTKIDYIEGNKGGTWKLYGITLPYTPSQSNLSNENEKQHIESNKDKPQNNINRTPDKEGEKLFSEMINPFAGKVVYVDFWGTGCEPCISSISKTKAMKEELKWRDDIVFLYIAKDSSPEDTWKAMIPNIKGEHYRASPDEWNYICNRFGVSGIPHYIIFDRKGKVINNNNNIQAGQSDLKEKLLEYAEM